MSMTRTGFDIYLSRPSIHKSSYIDRVLQSGQLGGDGEYTRLCEQFLSDRLESTVLLTSSCTAALEMAALLLDIQPYDEVILPSFTFPSTANAFVLRGATPIFSDIWPDTLNIEETLLHRLITSRTRAIVPVHYAGIGCEMDAIKKIATKYDIPVVEDNAHGLFGKYNGKHLGTIGDLGCLSFHVTKNFTGGEGGALIVNNPACIDRAYTVREKGTNRRQFVNGKINRYEWVDIGSSYLMSELQAALLWEQLQVWQEIQKFREALWNRYIAGLSHWATLNRVVLPRYSKSHVPAYHLFYLLLPDNAHRDMLKQHLAVLGIQSAGHFQPLHSSPMGRRWPADCPVTDNITERLLRLPFYTDLRLNDQDRIIEALTAYEF